MINTLAMSFYKGASLGIVTADACNSCAHVINVLNEKAEELGGDAVTGIRINSCPRNNGTTAFYGYGEVYKLEDDGE